MCPHVSLQLVRVSAGVAAEAALERTFTSVGADVALQFAHLENSQEVQVSFTLCLKKYAHL